MRFNHLNLTVPDVAESREFFETYFELKCLVEKGRNAIAVMTDGEGFILGLNNFGKAEEVAYPENFHVGFIRDSREEVDAIYERLKGDGFDVPPPRSFHGSWTFYFKAPGGIVVEVQHFPGHAQTQAN